MVKNSAPKFLYKDVRGCQSHTENDYLKLVLLWVVRQAVESRGVISFSHTGSEVSGLIHSSVY